MIFKKKTNYLKNITFFSLGLYFIKDDENIFGIRENLNN